MLKKIESTVRSESIRFGRKWLILGLIFLCIAGYLYRGYVPYETFLPTEEKVYQDVKVQLDSNLGAYQAEVASARVISMFSSRIDMGSYYLIPTQDPETGETYYMAIFAKPGQKKNMDKIAVTKEQLEAGELSGKKCTYYGTLLPLRNGIVELQKNYMQKQGFSDEELEQKVLPYYINVTSRFPIEVLILGILGLAFFGTGMYRLSRGISGSAYEAFEEDLRSSKYEKELLRKDLEEAENYGYNESIRIGQYMTYLNTDSYAPCAIRNDKILWVYRKLAFRDFLAKRGDESYTIRIYVDGEKRPYKTIVKNRMLADEVVKSMGTKFPWIIADYSKELEQKYRKDTEEFKKIQYNSVAKG